MGRISTKTGQGLYGSSGASLHTVARLYYRASVLRLRYDNNYFNDRYQGIRRLYSIFEKLLDGIDVRLNCDYFDH